jgi:hypothetical protein
MQTLIYLAFPSQAACRLPSECAVPPPELREIRFHCDNFEELTALQDDKLLLYLKRLCTRSKREILPGAFRADQSRIFRETGRITVAVCPEGQILYRIYFVPGPASWRKEVIGPALPRLTPGVSSTCVPAGAA